MSECFSADDAFAGLAESFWRLSNAIDAKVAEETDGLPDWMVAQVAADVRRECYPDEKRIWNDAYRRVMSAMARADIAAGYEPFTRYEDREQLTQGALL